MEPLKIVTSILGVPDLVQRDWVRVQAAGRTVIRRTLLASTHADEDPERYYESWRSRAEAVVRATADALGAGDLDEYLVDLCPPEDAERAVEKYLGQHHETSAAEIVWKLTRAALTAVREHVDAPVSMS